MKRCYLDANVLIYFVSEKSPYHGESIALISKLAEEKINLVISPLVLDEFLYVVQYELRSNRKRYVLIGKVLDNIMKLPNLSIVSSPTTNQAQRTVVLYMKTYGLQPRDAYHLSIIRSHKCTHFATFDTDFTAVFKQNLVQPAR